MLLSELFEQEEKHITFCFGRMNPPTIGHEQVFKTMASVGGEYLIFVSQTQDKKENPLGYEEKINFIKEIHPQYADRVVSNKELNTVVKVASWLYDQGYRNATFVAGSDRIDSFKKLLKDYNGVEGKSHGFYKFEVLDFISSGDRDPDSPGVAGISASKARAAAVDGNFEEFKKATGAGDVAKEMYVAVRKGLGIKESIRESDMKAKDFTVKKRDPNWQALQAKRSSGASGAHKDKKKAAKQGDVKHKNKEMAEADSVGKIQQLESLITELENLMPAVAQAQKNHYEFEEMEAEIGAIGEAAKELSDSSATVDITDAVEEAIQNMRQANAAIYNIEQTLKGLIKHANYALDDARDEEQYETRFGSEKPVQEVSTRK